MRTLMLVLMLLPQFAFTAENINVTSAVDRSQVGIGDVINLSVRISATDSVQVEEPHLPPLSGFDLINVSSGSETRSTFANGKFMTQQSRVFTYMLAVSQKGVLSIPEIPVQIEGKTYKTQPIKITANASRSAPQNQQAQRGRGQPQGPFQDMDDMEELFNQMLQRRMAPHFQGQPPGGGQVTPPVNPEEAFLILAETDKTKAYVGEQITVNYYLYTRGQIRDIDTLKYPDLRGFWKEELEMATRLNFEGAQINGVAYQRALLVSYALFPIKAGKATIDPYKAKCTVVTPSNFGFGRPYVFTKVSRPIQIEVLDVPAEGRPANFSGAVGSFRVSAQFEPPTGTVNQPVTLRVRFEGKGNAKLIELPKLELPASFELYDQKNQAKFLKDGTSFKEFEVMILPREPGVFNIPAAAAAVFDPQTRKFSQATSQPLNITVTGTATTPGAGQPQVPGLAPAPAAGAPPENELPDLTPDMEEGVVSVSALQNIFTVALFAAILALLGWKGWTSLRRRPKRANLAAVLKRRLKTVREFAASGDWRKVGVELTNTLYYVLGQISEQGGANVDLERLLQSTPPSLRHELSEKIMKLVERCEALSFAPEKLVGDLIEKPKLNALIDDFESVMNRMLELAEL